jgi:HEAT repeat protein
MVVTLALTLLAWQGQDVASLLEQLGDDSVERREAAVIALRRVGTSALPRLLPLRSSPDPEVARRACRTVGMIEWDPYLPIYGRPSDVDTWEQLGSLDPRVFLSGFLKIVSDARQGLGLVRKFHEESDEERKKLYLPHIGLSTLDPDLLYRWAEELPEDTFWGGSTELGDQLQLFFGHEVQPLKPEFWKRLLRSSNRSRRLLAALVLGRCGVKEGLDALIDFVDDPSRDIPYRAVGVLRNEKYRPAREKLLAVATKEGGEINAFYAMDEFGWAGAEENLRTIAARGDYTKVQNVHRELIKLGDRSFLPSVITRLMEGKGFLLFDRGFVAAALLYDTPEAIEAVLDRFSRVDHWGAHGMDEHFTFGPTGTRILWERFVAECKQGAKEPKCGMYLVCFTERDLLIERVREALKGDSPDPLKKLCCQLLWEWGRWRSLAPEDLDLLRSRALGDSTAEELLLQHQDRPFREILLRRLEKEPSASTLGALHSYDDPELKEVFLKYAHQSFSPEVRTAALKDVNRCGAKAVPALVAALGDDHEQVRDAALSVLPGFDPALFRDHENVLEKSFRISGTSYYRPKALECLAALNPRRAGLLAREALKNAPTMAYLPEAALGVIARQAEPGDAELARPYADHPQPNTCRLAMEILLELRPDEAWAALQRAALDRNEGRRKVALQLMARSRRSEAAPVLIQAAMTDSYSVAEVAVEALGQMGGADAEAFIRHCAADADRGRPAPEPWPVAAAWLRLDSVRTSLLKRLERSPDRTVLWALEVMLHRDAYGKTSTAREQTLHASSFAEAARELASRHQLEAWISPALEESVRKQLASHEPRERVHVSPCFDVDASKDLQESLRCWKPRIGCTYYSNFGATGFADEIPWASILEGHRLLFLTLDEARAKLMAAKK